MPKEWAGLEECVVRYSTQQISLRWLVWSDGPWGLWRQQYQLNLRGEYKSRHGHIKMTADWEMWEHRLPTLHTFRTCKSLRQLMSLIFYEALHAFLSKAQLPHGSYGKAPLLLPCVAIREHNTCEGPSRMDETFIQRETKISVTSNRWLQISAVTTS